MSRMEACKYKLLFAPCFVQEPSALETDEFNAQFHAMSLTCFQLLRKCPTVDPDTLISSVGAGITVAEFCLMWIKIQSFEHKMVTLRLTLRRNMKDDVLLADRIRQLKTLTATPFTKLTHAHDVANITQNLLVTK